MGEVLEVVQWLLPAHRLSMRHPAFTNVTEPYGAANSRTPCNRHVVDYPDRRRFRASFGSTSSGIAAARHGHGATAARLALCAISDSGRSASVVARDSRIEPRGRRGRQTG